MEKKKLTPYEKAVKYLSQVEEIDMMIGEKQDIIDSLWSSIMGTYTGSESERVQTSPKDRLSETCAKIFDLKEQLNHDIDAFVGKKMEIIQIIDEYIDDLRQRRLLYLRYLKFLPMESCAKEMHISGRTAYRLHNDAIHKISKKFEKG